MDPAIAATLIGVLASAFVGVLAGAFHLLRSDIRRVEGKLDNLVPALVRAGYLTDAQTREPPANCCAPAFAGWKASWTTWLWRW